jgi:salicylate hydroxylase
LNRPHALIAGAGIGGLTAAISLARTGWRVTLLERAPLLAEVGAGLQLPPNATRILHELGLLERISARGLSPRTITIRNASHGKILAQFPICDAENRWGAPFLVIHRADLQRSLVEAAAAESNITLRTGTEVAGFSSDAERVKVAAKQGLATVVFEGDCLIGADGLRSAIAGRMLGADATPHYVGRTAWRATVDAAEVEPWFREPQTNLWLGAHAHLVHYPICDGELINIVAIVEDDFRPDASTDIWALAGDPTYLHARFAKWHLAARDLIRLPRAWRKWPLFDRKSSLPWTRECVALLGDAAHPMLPFLAQGAAQAIEDAAALARSLADSPSIETGLATYEHMRHSRAARVQETSRKQVGLYHLTGPAALARNMAMKLMGPQRLLKRYDWLYEKQP